VQALKYVQTWASKNLATPILSSVNIKCEGEKITLTATDSVGLATRTLKAIVTKDFEASVPATLIPLIIAAANYAKDADDFTIKAALTESGNIFWDIGGVCLLTPIVSQKFPDATKLIHESGFKVSVGGDALAEALKAASVFSDMALLHVDDEKTLSVISVETQDGVGECRASIALSGCDAGCEVGARNKFNAEYMMRAVRDGGDMSIRFVDGAKAAKAFVMTREDGTLVLLMPMNMSAKEKTDKL
jgi:DNA polymerase III sliding clamp (beta) subunit (PCNA family)